MKFGSTGEEEDTINYVLFRIPEGTGKIVLKKN